LQQIVSRGHFSGSAHFSQQTREMGHPAGAVYDRWSRGRVHPVYSWGLALIVLGVLVRVALLGSPTWQHAMQSLFG